MAWGQSVPWALKAMGDSVLAHFLGVSKGVKLPSADQAHKCSCSLLSWASPAGNQSLFLVMLPTVLCCSSDKVSAQKQLQHWLHKIISSTLSPSCRAPERGTMPTKALTEHLLASLQEHEGLGSFFFFFWNSHGNTVSCTKQNVFWSGCFD